MKKIIKLIFPDIIINLLKLIKYNIEILKDVLYDFNRYRIYSATFNKIADNNYLIGRIIAHYHVIEKGLSLPVIRYGFGKPTILNLIDLLKEYENLEYDKNNISFMSAIGTILNYIKFHENANEKEKIKEVILAFEIIKYKKSIFGGTEKLNKEEILEVINHSSYDKFFNSRYSVRNYSDKCVDIKLIYDAIKIAQKAPSVCNRQASKVHIICNKELQKEVLKIHRGNRGFGDTADKLLIVTSDLSSFLHSNERNQSFVDGGIFFMALLNALHFKGLATCTLNWSVNSIIDKKLRNTISIPKSENIIALITVGHYKDEFYVASSCRKDIREIIKEY